MGGLPRSEVDDSVAEQSKEGPGNGMIHVRGTWIGH